MIAGFQTFHDWYVKQDAFFHSLQGLPLRMHDTVQISTIVIFLQLLDRVEFKIKIKWKT